MKLYDLYTSLGQCPVKVARWFHNYSDRAALSRRERQDALRCRQPVSPHWFIGEDGKMIQIVHCKEHALYVPQWMQDEIDDRLDIAQATKGEL